MKQFLVMPLLFIVGFLIAQKPGMQMEVSTFKLPKFPKTSLSKNSIAIAGIKIIHTLRDSVIMGYGMKGLDNHVVILVPEKPPTIFFQEAIDRMYQRDFTEGGAQLLWVVKDFRVGEKANSQYSYLRILADAYSSKDGIAYKPVCNLDTVFFGQGISDLTTWRGECVENTYRLLLKRTLDKSKEIFETKTEEISIEKIKLNSTIRNIPILSDEVYEDGAYANFEEFLENKPSITNYRVLCIGKEKQVKFMKIKENNEVDTVNVWGFCKGGEIYKFDNGLFVSIERQRNGFIISNYVEQVNRRNTGVFVTGMLGIAGGGLIVGIIAGSLTAAGAEKPLVVRSIPSITKIKKMPDATCIDMRTGELAF